MGTVHQFPVPRNQAPVPAETLAHALSRAIDATVQSPGHAPGIMNLLT